MYTGFVYFQGNEIANYDRTVAYLKGNPALDVVGMSPPGFIVSDCGCPSAMDCDFVSPRLDDAPWFDSAEAASQDFAGVLVVDVTGFDSTLSRTVTPNSVIGGSLTRQRAGPRTLLFDALLVANSCCGAEYGLRWLTEALRASDCGDDCGLGELYMLKCCPPDGDTCHLEAPAVDFTAFTDQVPFTVSVVATGPRTWQVTVVDSDRAGAVSTPGGAANNTLGLLPTCLGSVDSVAQFSIVPTPGSAFNVSMIPSEGVTNIALAASGTGATAVIDLDLNVSACDDVQRLIEDLEVFLCRWVGTYVNGAVSTRMLGQQQCWNVVAGYDPNEYKRYMKRVGLADGPRVIDRFGTCCSGSCASCQGSVIHVSWTLVSESPYIFGEVDWCMENEKFDKDTDYCFDVSTLCEDCPEIATQTITRERPRRTSGVQLRFDGTWCAEGWDPEEACPPVDSIVAVTSTVASVGQSVTIGSTSVSLELPALVNLTTEVISPGVFGWSEQLWDVALSGFPPPSSVLTPEFLHNLCGQPLDFDTTDLCVEDGSTNCEYEVTLSFGANTWTPVGWHPLFDGFPPQPCTVISDWACLDPATDVPCPIKLFWDPDLGTMTFEVLGSIVGCNCFEIVEYCLPEPWPVKLTYNECIDPVFGSLAKTWTVLGSHAGETPGDLQCLVITETEYIQAPPDPETCPRDVVDFPININCDGTWEPTNGTHDPCAVFPDPTRNYIVATVDNAEQPTGPVEESVQIPGSIFVPDCGPTLILPPAQAQSLFDCYCEPWCSNRLCCTLNNMEQWSDASTLVEFYTGDSELRNAKIQAFRNPFEDQGQTCPCDPADEFWHCRVPCAELQIPHLPAGAVLTVDSSIQVATVRFNNGIEQSALRYVQGPGGVPFNWFDVGHCSTLCIVVQADCTVDVNASVSVGLTNRYLASGT